MRQMFGGFSDADDAAIDDDRHVGHCRLEPIDAVVVQRRNVAVLFRRQAVEPRLARMHDQAVGAGGDHRACQRIECDFGILIINADAALDGDRHIDSLLHRGHTARHQIRLGHQARPEAAVLHTIRGAADIDVDFVITEIRADLRSLREVRRLRTAQLQRHRMFARVESKQPRAVAMDHGARRQHLRIEPRPSRQQTMEDAAMPVGPVHHRGNGEADVLVLQASIPCRSWSRTTAQSLYSYNKRARIVPSSARISASTRSLSAADASASRTT
jgi:hypothetical protein